MPKILVVDDEKPLREFVSRNLAARGYQVVSASNGLEALAVFNTEPLDLIVLDVMMPHMDGLETCRRIRQTSTVPIIVLTALGEESDKVRALDQGADDCLTKPFGVEELLARVRSMLRRSSWSAADAVRDVMRYRELELDPAAVTVICRGKPVKLTQTEFNLLHYFMQHVGKTLPHRLILKNVWGPEYDGEAEYLRVYIGRIRRKIELDPANPDYLITEYGLGYRFGR
ncbi:MAG: response regulator transcription factor [Anaerolineae bacterium]|nr:response regulator transcription factor [Anaerolineae bacterium]MCO5198622.1 response regulator transcription factor [Anaerolineae bacterium]